jgi:4-hydroxythreonine-4-phosphate dehydrogenase
VELIPRLVITPGEPAGIGPDVTLQIAQQDCLAELIVVGSPTLLRERAAILGLPLTLEIIDWSLPPARHQAGTLKIFPVELTGRCEPGTLNVDNSAYVIRTLELATAFCLHDKAGALVTGPVQKSIINSAEIPFRGHTEFLAERCQVTQSIMLFVVDQLKVALATTHIPLTQIANAITQKHLEKILRLLHQELQLKFHIESPRILVTGLNPHAGENGLLGTEEITIITPVIEKLRAEKMQVSGPYPADTIFTGKHLDAADVILAMYHDQALPVIKHIGFDRAVNVTLGLPIIRTSVDHGTALDLAGTGSTNSGSMAAAIQVALELVVRQHKQSLV